MSTVSQGGTARAEVVYANQTGGFHCLEDNLEGILLPLFNTFQGVDQEQLLHQHFVPKWSGWCSEGIDLETAEFVDEVFRATPRSAVERSSGRKTW